MLVPLMVKAPAWTMRLMADDNVTGSWKLVPPRYCTKYNLAVPTMAVVASKMESSNTPGGQGTSKVQACVSWGFCVGDMAPVHVRVVLQHVKAHWPPEVGEGLKVSNDWDLGSVHDEIAVLEFHMRVSAQVQHTSALCGIEG